MILSGRTYTCAAGDQIDMVSLAIYGSERYAADLLNANPKHALTQTFTGGEVLDIPIVVKPENNNGTVTMADVAPWKG